MLHRNKKQNDINRDKWIGIGGKFEAEEAPEECLLREAKEETGLTLTSWKCRGVVTFLNDCCEGEFMYLFTADGFTGELKKCDEGQLQWISREFLDSLPKWEGDKIFLDLLWQDAPFFLLTLLQRCKLCFQPCVFAADGFDESELVLPIAVHSAAQALQEMEVPYELHIFTTGLHGCAMGDGQNDLYMTDEHVAHWGPMCCEWLAHFGFEK